MTQIGSFSALICSGLRCILREGLRDLNFEYLAGKVPDAGDASLKSSLQDEAATL